MRCDTQSGEELAKLGGLTSREITLGARVRLALGATIPGMNIARYSLLLCLTLGIMGILTPFATGPSPVYYGSGYLPSKDYWRLGAIVG